MRRLLGILALVAMGTAACHNSARPPSECMTDAPIVAYGGVLPPPTDVVWYVPPPYYDNAPYYDDNDYDNSSSGGGTYYDDGSGSGDGWDTSDEPVEDPAPAPVDDSSGSSDDGWDDPDPARAPIQTKTLVGERAPNGCYVCQLVCTGGSSGGAVTATGASSHSYDRACLFAANRMQSRYAVTSCMNVHPQQN